MIHQCLDLIAVLIHVIVAILTCVDVGETQDTDEDTTKQESQTHDQE